MPVVIAAAPIAAVIAALVAATLLYALFALFQPLLYQIANSLPFIGSRVSSWVDDRLNRIHNSLSSWWASSVTNLTHALYAPARRLDVYLDAVNNTFAKVSMWIRNSPEFMARALGIANISGALWSIWHTVDDIKRFAEDAARQPMISRSDVEKIVSTMMADTISQIRGELQATETRVQQYAQDVSAKATATASMVQTSVNRLAVETGSVAVTLGNLVERLGNLTPGVVTGEITTAFDQARNMIESQASTLNTEIANTLTASERYASTLTSELTATLNRTMTDVNQRIGDVVVQLEGQIGTTAAGLRTYVDGQVGTIAANLATTAATLAQTMTLAEATDVTLTKYLKECGNQLCEWSRPQSQWTQNLFGMLDEGAMWALIMEAITDPEGTAGAFANMFGPEVQGMASYINDIMKGA